MSRAITYNFDGVKNCNNLRHHDPNATATETTELQKACVASRGKQNRNSTPMMHDAGTLLQAFKTSKVKWTQNHCDNIDTKKSELKKACNQHIASQAGTKSWWSQLPAASSWRSWR